MVNKTHFSPPGHHGARSRESFIRAAAAGTDATQLCALAREMQAQRGADFAATIIGRHWGLMEGRAMSYRMLGWLVAQAWRDTGRADSARLIADAFMDRTEQEMFDQLPVERLTVYRLTDASKNTGYYLEAGQAGVGVRRWAHNWRPRYLETLTVPPNEGFALKCVNRFPEIVLTPETYHSRSPKREFLDQNRT